MSKKMKVLTIGSLLLNVLLVGVIIGNMSNWLLRERFCERHAQEIGAKLSKNKAKLFLYTVEKVHLNNRNVHKQVRETRERAMKILTAREFDEAAYQIEVDKLHELRGLMMRRFADATIELTRQFNRKERKILAQYLRRPERPPRNVRSPRHTGPTHHEAP